jgi:hypothetical protein
VLLTLGVKDLLVMVDKDSLLSMRLPNVSSLTQITASSQMYLLIVTLPFFTLPFVCSKLNPNVDLAEVELSSRLLEPVLLSLTSCVFASLMELYPEKFLALSTMRLAL